MSADDDTLRPPPPPPLPLPQLPSYSDVQECVRQSVLHYFQDLDGETPERMHEMLVALVEKPLLEVVMAQAGHNQSRAAQWLGLNRNTLRKKLTQHRL